MRSATPWAPDVAIEDEVAMPSPPTHTLARLVMVAGPWKERDAARSALSLFFQTLNALDVE
jgi:hypothetical protein